VPPSCFFSFWSLALATRQSATAATAMKMCWPPTRHHRVVHLLRALHIDAAHAVRRGQRGRAGHQHHVGAGFARRARDRIAHLARGQIGDAAYRVDRFEGRAGGDQDALARQDLGLERGDQFFQQVAGSSMRPRPVFAAGLFAGRRAEQMRRRRRAAGGVALGGRVLPHLDIHRRRHQQRHQARARQAQVDSRSSHTPCASLRMKSAEQGAIRIASASRVRSMWAMLLATRGSHWSV
jgi:hypothetical protein